MLEMDYEEKESILTPGEGVLFYSEGLVEAHDPEGEIFGSPRLRALVAEHGEKQSLGDFLLKELRACANRRVAYVSKSSRKAVISL
jgi:serine phosphatase RsbU (regulator of sigma subunit)